MAELQSNELQGRISIKEANFLYDLIKQFRPNICLESGTGTGAGSTRSIVSSLVDNNYGVLYTYEEYKQFYDTACMTFNNEKDKKFVNIVNKRFNDGILDLNDEMFDKIDFVFLDGGDEAEDSNTKLPVDEYLKNVNLSENVQSFKYLENKLKKGTHVCLHDWSISGGRGNFVKQYLQSTNFHGFKLVSVLEGHTGLAHLIKSI
jgi:hypothetical protein